MVTDDELDVASVLFASEHRLAILECLRDGPARVSEVSSSLDVPHATVKHNLEQLKGEDLVRTNGSAYATTTYGETVRDQTTAYLHRITVARTLTPFLRGVEDSTADLDLLRFREADITAVDPTNPHAPTERLTELVATKEELRAVTPILPRQLHDVIRGGVVDRGSQADLLVTEDLFEVIRTRFEGSDGEALESDRLIIGVYPDPIPFGLFLFEDSLAILGQDEQNIPRCLVETDSEDPLRWANDLFRRFEKGAESFVFAEDDVSG